MIKNHVCETSPRQTSKETRKERIHRKPQGRFFITEKRTTRMMPNMKGDHERRGSSSQGSTRS
jgi:hypothetical protein